MAKSKPPQELLEEMARRIRRYMERDAIGSEAELARRLSKASGLQITRQLVHKWLNAQSEPGEMNKRALGNLFRADHREFAASAFAGQSPGMAAPLSVTRVAPRFMPDKNNPRLIRVEMSEIATVEQAAEIAKVFGLPAPKVP